MTESNESDKPLDTGVEASIVWTGENNRPKICELKRFISEKSMEAIESFGFTTLTQIQTKAIPPLLEGKDLRGTAKTGSGKTMAFVLPAIELLNNLGFNPDLGKFLVLYH